MLYIAIFRYMSLTGLLVAFKKYNIFKGIAASPWVGLKYFREAFQAREFWTAIKNTLVLNLGSLLNCFPFPIVFAVLLNELNHPKLKKTTQTVLYLPHFLSTVIVVGIVYQVFGASGVVNNALAALGMDQVNFLGNSRNWRILYLGSNIWTGLGYGMIVYLAAIAGINTELYDAAYIDGAGRWKRIRHVTLPQIRTTIVTMTVINVGKILSIGFEKPYLMSNVLVKDVSSVISTDVYSVGLQAGRYDYATAVGLFQSVVALCMVVAANSIARRQGEEKMGMEMPTTRDELIAVLYAMKENFPDITPYGFSGKITNGNYTNWLLSYNSRADERTNYIYEPTFTIVLKPGHKEGLKQLNQFVLDGIIDPNFVLDTDESKFSQDLANGKLGFIMDGAADFVRSAYETVEDPDYHMVEVDCIENADGNYVVPSQDPFSHCVYVPAASADRIDAIVKYLNFLSNEQNAIEVNMGMEGYGYDLVDGVYVERSRDKRIAAGTSSNPSDNCFLYSNFAYARDRLLDKFKASNPNTPEDVAEGKIASQYSNYFDRCLIPAALETDEYAPLLQTLIVEFVFKVMCAPEGQFEEVLRRNTRFCWIIISRRFWTTALPGMTRT